MSVQDLLNYAVIDGGQAPTNVASDTGDIGAMLKYLVERAKETTLASNISPTADANGSLAERIAYLQALAPTVAGVIQHPRDWAGGAGYAYWLGLPDGSVVDLVTAAAAGNPSGLDGWGWTVTAVGIQGISNGDFGSPTDLAPSYYEFAAASDRMRSPGVFGGYEAFLMAARFLGGMPTKMTLEFYAAWPVASSNNTTTFIGLVASLTSASDAAAAGHGPCIVSDGTNFRLVSDNANDAGAAVDNAWHLWRIEVGITTTEWFIDDVSQGTVTTEPDIWPCAFTVLRGATGNTIGLSWARLFYSL